MNIPFERMCRACMTESTTTLMPIWPSIYDINGTHTSDDAASSIVTMFRAFTVFGASHGDGLPENICLTCIGEMNQAYSFKQKCERSELALRAFQRKMMHTKDVNSTNNRSVTTVVSLNRPADIESKPVPFDGKPSFKQFSYSVQDQITDSSGKPIYQCANCWMTFDSNKEIETHLLGDLCVAEYSEKSLPDDVDVDYDTENLQDNNECQTTEKKEKPNVMCNVNEAMGSKPKFICENCNASFAMQHSLNVHRNSKKCLEQTFECDICKHVFSTKRNIRRHIHRMHLYEKIRKNAKDPAHEKKYKCSQCSKAFIMQSGLRDHLRTHSGERPFLCSMCGKGFGQSANLRQHMMRHSQMKPYQCDECPKSFVSKGELNSHKRIHDGAHPFVCDICGSGFTTSSSMTKHRRIHTGERRYACEYCPLRFTALSTMKNHRRIHTGERPYQCQYCSRSFSQRSDCVSHTRIHTGERPYKCEICPAQFYKSCSLRTHMKKDHDMTLESTAKRYQNDSEKLK